MTKTIVYQQNNQTIILKPAEGADWQAIAAERVPSGVDYIAVDAVPQAPIKAWVLDHQAGTISVDPQLVEDHKWAEIREERNRRLRECDWAMLPDSPYNNGDVMSYRNALRNLPQNFATPDVVVWPESPFGSEES